MEQPSQAGIRRASPAADSAAAATAAAAAAAAGAGHPLAAAFDGSSLTVYLKDVVTLVLENRPAAGAYTRSLQSST